MGEAGRPRDTRGESNRRKEKGRERERRTVRRTTKGETDRERESKKDRERHGTREEERKTGH